MFYRYFIFVVLAAVLTTTVFGQTKKTQPPTPAVPQPSATPETALPSDGPKKNGRPAVVSKAEASSEGYLPTYFFEFTRPGFIISHITIEHDASGRGKISFLKKDLDQMLTDPLQLSAGTLKTIDDTLARMDFLGSTENYQYEQDRSNMGDNVIRIVKDGRERTTKYNWTTNPDAKLLMDEYRRVGNEAVWKFDLASARVNQPLDTPRLLDSLDSYIQRNEISDAPHLIPLLQDINNDERLPLIARNHAARLIKRIESVHK
ncbi:MAG: hypothetical protein ABJA02_14885 [Acidobacteriota bacterium]